jgi:hypothetical protein
MYAWYIFKESCLMLQMFMCFSINLLEDPHQLSYVTNMCKTLLGCRRHKSQHELLEKFAGRTK